MRLCVCSRVSGLLARLRAGRLSASINRSACSRMHCSPYSKLWSSAPRPGWCPPAHASRGRHPGSSREAGAAQPNPYVQRNRRVDVERILGTDRPRPGRRSPSPPADLGARAQCRADQDQVAQDQVAHERFSHGARVVGQGPPVVGLDVGVANTYWRSARSVIALSRSSFLRKHQ